MQDDSELSASGDESNRWTLIRDIGVLQVKLVVDGIRDLVLVPISLVVGILSLLKPGGPGNDFYDLLRLGKRSERWINLFGAIEKMPTTDEPLVNFPDEDIDSLLGKVETFVVDEYRKGGVTKQAKDGFDKAINSLHALATRRTNRKTGVE